MVCPQCLLMDREEQSNFWVDYTFSSGERSFFLQENLVRLKQWLMESHQRLMHLTPSPQCLKTQSRISELLNAMTYSTLRKHTVAKQKRPWESAEHGEQQAMTVLSDPRKTCGHQEWVSSLLNTLVPPSSHPHWALAEKFSESHQFSSSGFIFFCFLLCVVLLSLPFLLQSRSKGYRTIKLMR